MPYGDQPSTRFRNDLEFWFQGDASYGVVATAAAVSALVGRVGTSCSSPTARFRPRFVCRSIPFESVSIRTRKDVASAALNTNGPVLTGLPDPPKPSAPQSADCLC